MKVHSVEYVFTKVQVKRLKPYWTVGIVEDGQQVVLTVQEFNKWQKDMIEHGLQLVWSDGEMTFQMYGRYFDIPEDVLEHYKIEGFTA